MHGVDLPLGWALVIAVLIYVVDRRNLWKRAGIPIALVIIAIISYPTLREKVHEYHSAKHIQMKRDVIARFKSTNPNVWQKVCSDDVFRALEVGERSEVIYAIQEGVTIREWSLCD